MIAKPLTERLELMNMIFTGNTTGEGVEVPITFAVVYASLTKQQGSVRFNDGPDYFDNVSFYLRYFPGLEKKGLRVKYNDGIYKVNNITVIPRNEALVLDCVLAL